MRFEMVRDESLSQCSLLAERRLSSRRSYDALCLRCQSPLPFQYSCCYSKHFDLLSHSLHFVVTLISSIALCVVTVTDGKFQLALSSYDFNNIVPFGRVE